MLLINPYRFVSALHVANANERLSLLGLSPGDRVIQHDTSTTYQYNGDAEAVQIIGAGTEATNGYYTKRGTQDGKPYYNLIGQPNSLSLFVVKWIQDSLEWRIVRNTENGPDYLSSDVVAYPWLVTTWNQNNGDAPVPTTTHIASKNALIAGMFVSAAGAPGAHGLFTERGRFSSHRFYNRAFVATAPNYASTYWENGGGFVNQWWITDESGAVLYYADSEDVEYPSLVSNWTGLTPPDPTMVAVTLGEIDAGLLVTSAVSAAEGDITIVSPQGLLLVVSLSRGKTPTVISQ